MDPDERRAASRSARPRRLTARVRIAPTSRRSHDERPAPTAAAGHPLLSMPTDELGPLRSPSEYAYHYPHHRSQARLALRPTPRNRRASPSVNSREAAGAREQTTRVSNEDLGSTVNFIPFLSFFYQFYPLDISCVPKNNLLGKKTS